ncbi:Eco57I restriction-modification methylase domain-containing protein [Caldovatus aquaticus]|uniref:site-specific DNA-methyltransferase (adenine-specific) n=1 Tax=Caldovatus aquaticus TaxID=2865671 RepID=A0ABS7F5S8_9PROT|nr:N-6 DNA methylase [Caldovatus aquaticus]MBW8270914.1 N-6 DNA methylase [Caldovatus aquaticus]
MPRKPVTDIAAWPALTLEGNLISPAMIASIDRREAPEQGEADYGLRKGISIRDEISLAFRVGQAHYADFLTASAVSATATIRFVRDFLRETLGFADLREEAGPVALTAGEGRVPVVVVPPADELDRRSATLSQDRSRSAVLVLQDRLGAAEGALWGLATNGRVLRLMRDNASLTRPAYIEADLAQIFETEDVASFALVWLLMHRTRFGRAGAPATDCALERWREAGAKAGEAARDRLAGQVELALKELGSGFLEANRELREKLAAQEIALTEWFNELLRLVYRLIFLMVAEDRNLLHPPAAGVEERRLYAEGYSLAMLRAQAARRGAWDRHHDRYEGLKVVFRALAGGEPRLGLPALGGLFAPGLLPTLEAARLPNRAFLSAIYRLGWISDGAGMAPVNWQAMETEELGSVYESLLELQPQLAEEGRRLVFASDAAEARGNQRKTTGSYYTPDSLVQALLDTALDPVLDRAEAAAEDPAEALLSLTVVDPACGSGHFLLAAARRIATRVARHRAGGTPSAEDFRHALRDVARRCLHGVDRNPMAVELTKVALWIETVDPGLPLGFFDAQIRCGDSLLGVFDLTALEKGIPDGAYKPLAGDDRETARHFAARNRSERAGQGSLDFARGGGALPAARQFASLGGRLRALPEDTPEQVAERARLFAALRGGPEWYAFKVACDAYVAAFLVPKTGGVPANRHTVTIPTTAHVWEAMAGRMPFGPLVGRVVELAEAARAFHWPLEFPDVMARGGFDVVLGNPPWERIKLQEQEFFAARSPEIAAAPNKAARERLIKALEKAPEGSPERALHAAFLAAKREAEAASEFARTPGEEGGRFPLTGRGDINTYALFAELFARLAAPQGRAGMIVPTGIATDATTAPFFAHLVADRRLVRLVDFENRAGLFPAVDSRMKFSLLTLGRDAPAAEFAFFLTDVAQLADAERRFTLSPEQIARLNPNTRTAPVFRSRADADLTAKIYARVPVLVEDAKGPAGNPWGVSFARLFDMANDSALFRTAAQLAAAGFVRQGTAWVAEGARPRQGVLAAEGGGAGLFDLPGAGPRAPRRYLPLYEAKMIHQFDHRWAGYAEDGETTLDIPPERKRDPGFEPDPRYWVPEEEVEQRLRAKGWSRGWLLGWRDIARATDERTVIATVFPRVGVGNKIPLILSNETPEFLVALSGNLSSLVFDFVSRQKIGGTTLNFFIFNQLPVLPPAFYTAPRLAFLLPRVLELTYTSHALAPFARDLGHTGPPFAWDEARRARLRAELDAFYARAYGLTRDEMRYILDPAEVKGPAYPSETFRVLKEKEIRLYGEYRTARLTLAAWDAMEADGSFRAMDLP